VSDETPAASHSVGASHLSLVTLELRGQSRNSLLQLARSRSIATRRVFAANNCFLIAATCAGERAGASVMRLATRRTDDKLHVHQVWCSMLALIDVAVTIAIRRTGRPSLSSERERAS
jgi:hypothetical protein